MNYKIHELCSINAYNLTKNDDWDYIYYLDTANLNEGTISDLKLLRRGIDKIPSRAKRKVKNNDILLSTVRPSQKHYGIMKNIPNRLIASTGFAVLTPNEELVYPEYLYRCLTQDKIILFLQAVAETSTSAYPLIKPSVIGDLEIELPSLEEQKAIAHILSTLDEKIELNKKINKTLEDIAQAIFKHWFVDFEFPNENGEPYKSSGGEMVESELGMIPKGWEVIELGNLVEIVDNRGKTPPQENQKTNYPIIDVKALSGDSRIIDYNKCIKYVSRETYNSWFRSGHPKEGDILLSTVGSLAEMKIFSGNIGCIAQNVVALRCIGTSNLYLYQYLKHIKSDLVSYNIGSVQPSIKITHIIKHKILKPDMKIENQFHSLIKNLTELIINNCFQNNSIVLLRDTLLPKLMSGEIRVPRDQEEESEEVS